ncbi:GntR family transcriptional regulator [Microbacterium testaceum]|uniref:GntR family transcriptional regulator n=1 Tax=Microbacterium testaceum TaxID=2033 RepID=A0A147EU45_MICTE|nr:FCD domain-containing protein [Microbacterium testaceum]KTR90871.1 GntR family transcriptional regulator [Microbacterium testaceum]
MASPSTPDHADAGLWLPVKRARAHELVIEVIEDRILSGTLQVGDALPPERELAANLEVSRAGVREAVRVLESQGVLRSQPGAGAAAGTFVAALPREALSRFLRLHVALSNFTIEDVTEARIVLERASAASATRRLTDVARTRIADALAAGDTALGDRVAFNEADTRFHLAIADASGSSLSAALTGAIREAVRIPLLHAIERKTEWSDQSAQLQREHHAIFEAIIAGDAEHAADVTEAHIRRASSALFTED